MTKLWPNEVFRKFKLKTDLKLGLKFEIWAKQGGGKIPARTPRVDRGVDTGGGVDSPVDTPVDMVGLVRLVGLWVGLGGWFLESSEI